MGRRDEAIAQYRQALQIRPDFTEARFNMTQKRSPRGLPQADRRAVMEPGPLRMSGTGCLSYGTHGLRPGCLDGVTVELYGVSENPSKERPWWRPDGSLLKTAV